MEGWHHWWLVTDGILPRAYGLPKNPQDHPLRMIVSYIDSPLYLLASYLHEIIYNSIPKYFNHTFKIINFHLVNQTKWRNLDDGYKLISLDVVSLFTNVPTDFIVNNIMKRWNYMSRNTSIPMKELLATIAMIQPFLHLTYNFINRFFGTLVDFPLSPVLTDIILQNIEEAALNHLPASLPFYYRYINDILLAAPLNLLDNI